jgi:hypothetical protein
MLARRAGTLHLAERGPRTTGAESTTENKHSVIRGARHQQQTDRVSHAASNPGNRFAPSSPISVIKCDSGIGTEVTGKALNRALVARLIPFEHARPDEGNHLYGDLQRSTFAG